MQSSSDLDMLKTNWHEKTKRISVNITETGELEVRSANVARVFTVLASGQAVKRRVGKSRGRRKKERKEMVEE